MASSAIIQLSTGISALPLITVGAQGVVNIATPGTVGFGSTQELSALLPLPIVPGTTTLAIPVLTIIGFTAPRAGTIGNLWVTFAVTAVVPQDPAALRATLFTALPSSTSPTSFIATALTAVTSTFPLTTGIIELANNTVNTVAVDAGTLVAVVITLEPSAIVSSTGVTASVNMLGGFTFT